MAIAYRQHIDDDTEFALWRIEEEADDLYKQLQLDDEEKAYVEKLSNGKRHLHWLGTRVLLRKMLHTDEYIDCKVDAHGKPYLVNLPYHISFSHSFDYAAVMISKTHKVGIDIEQIKQKVERIAGKFLRPDEMAFIDDAHKIEQLYVCWCAKEAIYKCNGEKEVSFADNIFLDPFSFNTRGELSARLHKNNINLDYVVSYMQYEDYMIGYVKGQM
ncbi:4'-phosphopantetheinyl transferase family protein [Mucilaginibacter lappiensis]|uniref:Phosphopantetheinyl transferase n=1 Tax=Mucilaginibacter lappiensis TaxID=354630 RepID=A0A1N7GI20_9SPHI|nr:4'-phosphopantetheinyl transferase superfamily protein [Mucilaginibacter lappiensis]MBB6113077.1 phosphopantetheinyl transferase [Mucilaginibacter lappiensis]MBB6129675.1 phosphopantetheinyl transferase [Mucilaginibacter lappiensis]SIS12166.1 4'-phosphopantetheinyl transferase superfamily protein [Mucilaginibacter lappiensis]